MQYSARLSTLLHFCCCTTACPHHAKSWTPRDRESSPGRAAFLIIRKQSSAASQKPPEKNKHTRGQYESAAREFLGRSSGPSNLLVPMDPQACSSPVFRAADKTFARVHTRLTKADCPHAANQGNGSMLRDVQQIAEWVRHRACNDI